MKTKTKYGLIIATIVAVMLISGCAQKSAPVEENNYTEDYKVKNITTIKEYGKSMDWSHTKDMIAFGKRGKDGYYDVCIMNSDGSGEICLTCDKEECPQKHNGNPAWHPSGDYIVFTAEKKKCLMIP